MNEFCILIADQKSGKYITYDKIRRENFVRVLSNEEREERSERRNFLLCKTFVKKENGVQTCNFYIFSTKHSAAPQLKGFNREFAKRRRL